MNPFIELMQAGALIMLLFAVVLIAVVIRNMPSRRPEVRWGPVLIGIALLLFAVPIYASVAGSSIDFGRFTPASRMLAAILLPIGLFLLGAFGEEGLGRQRPVSSQEEAPADTEDDAR